MVVAQEHMAAHGHTACCARRSPGVNELPLMDFKSGYVKRALGTMPKQGVCGWGQTAPNFSNVMHVGGSNKMFYLGQKCGTKRL